MDRTTVTDAVYDACEELLRADRSTLSESTHFANDLEADSLDLSEVVMALEDQLGVEITDDQLEGVETIGQAVDMVMKIAPADA
ncbi:acyl carrier protein [Aquihabitans sp. McL0605]|uniref:acyl carrier protein n=1 Tax=Aquihabitans sp. McL0605 TaxID=3415671 RepID=UPI003CEDD24A